VNLPRLFEPDNESFKLKNLAGEFEFFANGHSQYQLDRSARGVAEFAELASAGSGGAGLTAKLCFLSAKSFEQGALTKDFVSGDNFGNHSHMTALLD
jgi:hypothetical protein